MATDTAVPVIVQPEARSWITARGMGGTLDQILNHALEAFPDLRRLQVRLVQDPEDPPDTPGVLIEATFPSWERAHLAEMEWDPWFVSAVPWQEGYPFCFLGIFTDETDDR